MVFARAVPTEGGALLRFLQEPGALLFSMSWLPESLPSVRPITLTPALSDHCSNRLFVYPCPVARWHKSIGKVRLGQKRPSGYWLH